MSAPRNNDSGYFVDAEKAEEAVRLAQQGDELDKIMRLLPAAIPDPRSTKFRILDVGCSSGGWASAVAARYFPHVHVTGIDISENMLRAAKARAIRDKIQQQTAYEAMDARYSLKFENASFDLIHGRLLFAFQTRESWPLFFEECSRLLKPGGYLVLTENDAQCWTTSPALAEYYRLGHEALSRHSNSYQKEYVGIVAQWPNLLKDMQILSMETYRIDIGQGSRSYDTAAKDHMSLYRDLQDYYINLGVATQKELDELYHQMVLEIKAPDFNGYWIFTRLTAKKVVEQ